MSEHAAHDKWVAVAYEFAIAHRIIHSRRPNAERRSGAHVLKHIAHVRKAQAISPILCSYHSEEWTPLVVFCIDRCTGFSPIDAEHRLPSKPPALP